MPRVQVHGVCACRSLPYRQAGRFLKFLEETLLFGPRRAAFVVPARARSNEGTARTLQRRRSLCFA